MISQLFNQVLSHDPGSIPEPSFPSYVFCQCHLFLLVPFRHIHLFYIVVSPIEHYSESVQDHCKFNTDLDISSIRVLLSYLSVNDRFAGNNNLINDCTPAYHVVTTLN